MFCTNCGKEINDGSKFCRYCGQVFENKKNKTIDYQSQMTGYAAGTTTQHV